MEYEKHLAQMHEEELHIMVSECRGKLKTAHSPTYRNALQGLIDKCNSQLQKLRSEVKA